MLTITNDFTGCETTIDPSKPFTRKRIKAIRSRLHVADCTSGDALGGRGRQEDPALYDFVLQRVEQVAMSGRSEAR